MCYTRGQDRLLESPFIADVATCCFRNQMPPGSPSHRDKQYAFKGYALAEAAQQGATVLLWADACILPIRSLEPLWDKIERDGYWISRNGFSNYTWTADTAYADLGVTPEENRSIEHVVATSFGLSLEHPTGKRIFDEYFRLAQTNAFKGPWKNGTRVPFNHRTAPCGPPDVMGHRHDQTALSVCAWREGCVLTNPPEFFAYKGGENNTTVMVADASAWQGMVPPQ
jgi:hypothetical protein